VQPIRAIGKIAREHGVPLIVDAAQSAGHIPIDVQADGIDLLAAPGHKGLLGPLGTGFLYIRPGIEKILAPIREGGTGSISEHDRQPDFLPDKYECGSHNANGIAGLSAALGWIEEQTIEKLHAHDLDLARTFLDGISDIEGLTTSAPQGVKTASAFFRPRRRHGPMDLSAALEMNSASHQTRPALRALIHKLSAPRKAAPRG
jgi:selenocysteine lyase/cysteine desulfurase